MEFNLVYFDIEKNNQVIEYDRDDKPYLTEELYTVNIVFTLDSVYKRVTLENISPRTKNNFDPSNYNCISDFLLLYLKYKKDEYAILVPYFKELDMQYRIIIIQEARARLQESEYQFKKANGFSYEDYLNVKQIK